MLSISMPGLCGLRKAGAGGALAFPAPFSGFPTHSQAIPSLIPMLFLPHSQTEGG